MKAINQKAKKIIDTLTENMETIGDHRKIDNAEGTFMSVHVECIGRCNYGLLYSIAHYYEQNGDMVCDPDMVFIKAETDGNYYPVSFEQGGLIHREAVLIKNGIVTEFHDYDQRDQASFANVWMRNIKEQQNL